MIDLSSGFLLYGGPSVIDGEPIVCVVTNPDQARLNVKTQRVVQTYILRADEDPVRAIRVGLDVSICGDCRHRGDGTGNGRSCYVQVWGGVRNIWLAYRRGKYAALAPHEVRQALAGSLVRVGAYGDPAALPLDVWSNALLLTSGALGYSHRWRSCDARFKTFCMASVDTEDEQREASALGWRTFRVRRAADRVLPGEVVCAASAEAGKKVSCAMCRACGGTNARAHAPIVIAAHGDRGKIANFERWGMTLDDEVDVP